MGKRQLSKHKEGLSLCLWVSPTVRKPSPNQTQKPGPAQSAPFLHPQPPNPLGLYRVSALAFLQRDSHISSQHPGPSTRLFHPLHPGLNTIHPRMSTQRSQAASFLKHTLQVLPACPSMIIRVGYSSFLTFSYPILLNLVSLHHFSGGPFQLRARSDLIHQLNKNYFQ